MDRLRKNLVSSRSQLPEVMSSPSLNQVTLLKYRWPRLRQSRRPMSATWSKTCTRRMRIQTIIWPMCSERSTWSSCTRFRTTCTLTRTRKFARSSLRSSTQSYSLRSARASRILLLLSSALIHTCCKYGDEKTESSFTSEICGTHWKAGAWASYQTHRIKVSHRPSRHSKVKNHESNDHSLILYRLWLEGLQEHHLLPRGWLWGLGLWIVRVRLPEVRGLRWQVFATQVLATRRGERHAEWRHHAWGQRVQLPWGGLAYQSKVPI